MDNVLFKNVNIIDGTGADRFSGQVLIEGNRIKRIALNDDNLDSDNVRVIDGAGKTLMPGLCDAHLHLTWNDQPTLEFITMMPPEEHLIHSVNVARKLLDSGFTSGVGAASARPRFDCVLRNAINEGHIVGPRYLANTQEITTTGGLGDTSPPHVDIDELSFGWRISGPDEMRKTVRQFIKYGVDLIKLNLSGEEITPIPARATTMSEEEVDMAMTEARRYGIRACAHARSADSVKQCLDHGIEIIYHASFADEECLDRLEEHKDKFFVGPGLAWLVQTAYGAAEFGIPPESELAQAYANELEVAVEAMKKMHARGGIRVLPGGDYGFAWTPHGTNAKDLQYFVEMIGMTPMEAIVSATKMGGEIMGQPNSLGLIAEGYFADVLLVDGNPEEDITVLQDHNKLEIIMKDGEFHKDLT
ncbi:MAG: amidohydrolase family protein [Gammaproteobacteria bacterium]|nr:amidohydrolase family protein [Gammaproteobacteria bacterium]